MLGGRLSASICTATPIHTCLYSQPCFSELDYLQVHIWLMCEWRVADGYTIFQLILLYQNQINERYIYYSLEKSNDSWPKPCCWFFMTSFKYIYVKLQHIRTEAGACTYYVYIYICIYIYINVRADAGIEYDSLLIFIDKHSPKLKHI